ncbi:GGDEF domain-containing protein [Stenotrophomonas sp. PS02297]|uniref:GGDEF domain-containing protein n=1 Tax=Stenotrophomonas sp. PS02297 TaxID=2991423 RepID=UPI00249A3384|nr:GGDEF domain-containing protein [Stenotrophomonas sp. PS02297]
MADSTDTPPPKPAGLGRILSRRQSMAEPTAPAAPAPASHGHGAAPLQRMFAQAHAPEALLHAFAQGMSSLPGELGDLGRLLQSAYERQEWERYGRLLRQLIDKYIRTIELEPAHGGNGEAERLRDMLRNTLGAVLSSLLQQAPELETQARRMGEELRGWRSGQSLEPVEQHLRELCHQVGVRNDVLHEQHDLLLNLFDLLLQNIAELIDGGSWLHGQIGNVRQMLAGPLDRTSLERTRNDLREVIYRQGVLKQGIDESKAAMRDLMVDFVEQVDGMASQTGEYHDRIASYAVAVRQARSLADLGQLLQSVLQDTARLQSQALRARDRLSSARAEALAAEQRVQQLERELEEAGSQLRTDPLTGALNRRGLQELLADAMGAAQAPLSIAMLDLDHFSQTNADYGHAGGDHALRHLVATTQTRLGSHGQVARLGGDEFVLVLPGMPQDQADAQLRRLQEALAHRPFLHEGQRVHVRFSAGIAQWRAGESADALLQRADRALYAAKQAGRDRVGNAG